MIPPCPQFLDARFVDIKTHDRASGARERRRDRQPNVTQANDRNFPAV
jgi:hypothetical protein